MSLVPVPVLSLLAIESTVDWSREEGVGEGVPLNLCTFFIY
jgi:hypothetical protein